MVNDTQENTAWVYTEDKLPSFVNQRIIPLLAKKRVWAFYGDLGAGKTTLIKEICAQLGVPRKNVNSPTFALVNEYSGSDRRVFHFDFYRIRSEEEAYDLGYEEYFFGSELCLVEWPERVEPLLPRETVRVTIEQTAPDKRTYKIDDHE